MVPNDALADWTHERTSVEGGTNVKESISGYFDWRWFDLLFGGPYCKFRTAYAAAGMEKTLKRLKAYTEKS